MTEKKHILLDKIGKEIPFSTPENYFEEFPELITKKIKEKERLKSRILRRWSYAIAACIVGIIMLTQTSLLNMNTSTTDDYDTYIFSQVDESTIFDYYLENQDQK